MFLVLQIAFGVAMGVVLAYVILTYPKELLRIALVIVGIGVVLGVLGLGLLFVWLSREQIGHAIDAILASTGRLFDSPYTNPIALFFGVAIGVATVLGWIRLVGDRGKDNIATGSDLEQQREGK